MIYFKRFKKNSLKLLYRFLALKMILYYLQRIKNKKMFSTYLKLRVNTMLEDEILCSRKEDYILNELKFIKTKVNTDQNILYGEIIKFKRKVKVKQIITNNHLTDYVRENLINSIDKYVKNQMIFNNRINHPKIAKFYGKILIKRKGNKRHMYQPSTIITIC